MPVLFGKINQQSLLVSERVNFDFDVSSNTPDEAVSTYSTDFFKKNAKNNSKSAGGKFIKAQWWPYQRPTFVTPPFAGYVSGHSTYSRAAAEVLTLITGDEYFPGGLGEFKANKNDFLVFEQGPSVDVTLQWATYRDAADQCGLSRIWGGIHPPIDDIPGRLMGRKIGINAVAFAESYFKEIEPKPDLEKGWNIIVVSEEILLSEFKNQKDIALCYKLTNGEYIKIQDNEMLLPTIGYTVKYN